MENQMRTCLWLRFSATALLLLAPLVQAQSLSAEDQQIADKTNAAVLDNILGALRAMAPQLGVKNVAAVEGCVRKQFATQMPPPLKEEWDTYIGSAIAAGKAGQQVGAPPESFSTYVTSVYFSCMGSAK
jgi:hypothetical protein